MRFLRQSYLLIAFCVPLALAGCNDRNVLSFEQNFSWNIIRTPAWFPDEKETPLAAGQKEVFDKRGRPDFIRIYWRPDGTPITSRDLAGQDPHKIQERVFAARKSWVYTTDNEEVVFLANETSYRVQPIDDKLKLLTQYGDPSNMSQPVVRNGQTHEYWQWIEHGIQVELVDGVELNRSYFKGTGAGTYLLK